MIKVRWEVSFGTWEGGRQGLGGGAEAKLTINVCGNWWVWAA